MDNEEIADYLRANLRIEIDYTQSRSYYDSSSIKIRLMLEDEEISESVVGLPDWEEKRSEF